MFKLQLLYFTSIIEMNMVNLIQLKMNQFYSFTYGTLIHLINACHSFVKLIHPFMPTFHETDVKIDNVLNC